MYKQNETEVSMKRILFITLMIAVISTGLLFARGSEEEESMIYSRWGIAEDADTISAAGSLRYENRIFPELSSGGNTWKLIYPHYFDFEVEVEEGERITVEGYQVEGPHPRFSGISGTESIEDDQYLLLSKAVIDGEEYTLEDFDAPHYAMDGRFGGRRGPSRGRGPRMGGPGMGGPGMVPGYGPRNR